MSESTGGYEVVTRAVHVTYKAWCQYEEFNYGDRRRELAIALTGVTVRRMADDSPYFIYTTAGMRYVFVLQNGHKLASAKFALVTVQENQKAV